MLFFSLNRYIFHQGILRTLWSCMYICRQRQRGGLYDVITMKWFHIEPCIIQNKDCRRTYKDFQTMTFSKSTRWNKMSRIHSDNSFIHTFPSHMGVSLRFVYVCSKCPFYDVYIAHITWGSVKHWIMQILVWFKTRSNFGIQKFWTWIMNMQGLFMSENLRTVCICSKDERIKMFVS